MPLAALALLAGIALLTLCAELAVGAAERLSERLGLSPVLIGALVVGLGTSLPEMVVSGVAAAERDTIDLAIGNIIGSNTANLSLVLGVGATITVITARRSVMRRESLLMLAATAIFSAFIIDNHLSTWEGAALLGGMVVAAFIVATSPENGSNAESRDTNGKLGPMVVRVIIGLAGVLIGAQLMVTGAVEIAEDLGASEAFIGLSIVALGTSLPELATTVVSARRGSLELVVGNVLGSNMFNSLAVGGVAGLLGTGVIDEPVVIPVMAMLAISVAVVGRGLVKHTFTRPVGVLLILSYVALLAIEV